jgi:hypothetical protein
LIFGDCDTLGAAFVPYKRVSALEEPPGFRAAPHAANGVMSIRLQSLTPSRLSALRAPLAGIQTR